jgi:hypothetical protein
LGIHFNIILLSTPSYLDLITGIVTIVDNTVCKPGRPCLDSCIAGSFVTWFFGCLAVTLFDRHFSSCRHDCFEIYGS